MALANIKVYRDIKELRNMIYDDVVRLPKHLKFPLGSLIIDGLFVLPKLLSEILHSQSSTHKVATLNIVFHELDVLRDQVEFLCERHCINLKRCAKIYLLMDSIERQLGAWRKSLSQQVGQSEL